MNGIYYQLKLKPKDKSPKRVNVSYKNYDLTHLNLILNSTLKDLRRIKSQKTEADVQIIRLLKNIIPDEYFGSNMHRRQFNDIVKLILTQSAYECIYMFTLFRHYDYTSITWLDHIENENHCEYLLYKTNFFLLEKVVKPLIKYYYRAIETYNGHEIRFVRLETWNTFETKIFNHMLSQKHLIEFKEKNNEFPKVITARGYLKLIPKGDLKDLTYRPIVVFFQNYKTYAWKQLKKNIYNVVKRFKSSSNIFKKWSLFFKENHDKEVFGIKLDIQDAYGNVDVTVLCQIITAVPSKLLSHSDKTFIIHHIKSQFVMFRKQIYHWQHGLLQGDPMSAPLCELYMSYVDQIHLPVFDSSTFFDRTVDDYFFCSSDRRQVNNFKELMCKSYQINDTKTQSNLEPSSSNELVYCGKQFNLATKQVKISFNLGQNYHIRHRFKLWNIQEPVLENNYKIFISKVMSFKSCGSLFGVMELNTIFNSQRTVLENFFDGMVYVAYKFDSVIMTVRNNFSIENSENFFMILKKTVLEYVVKVSQKINEWKGNYYKEKISEKVLISIAFRAFILVLKRRNEIYIKLIKRIKKSVSLNINIPNSNVNFLYFTVLPSRLKNVKINRKNNL